VPSHETATAAEPTRVVSGAADEQARSSESTLPGAGASTSDRAPVAVETGLLTRAKQNDHDAIETMFRQFLPLDERIAASEYLGVFGFWGFGRDSFAIATERRVAGMQVGAFGEVFYQDAPLEFVNSTILYQPSRIGLYVTVGVVAVFTLGIGLLLAPVIARVYYRRKKSGLVLAVREGVSVYVFIDRKNLRSANRLCRDIARLREDRIRRVGWV
jgi:hypothetical protein